MRIKDMLRKFLVKYGSIGMMIPSWKGSYEPKVPDLLLKTVASKQSSPKAH